MLLRNETKSNSQYKFTLITAYCKGIIELNLTKLFTIKTEYTILIRVNVSNIGTNLMLFNDRYFEIILKLI